MTLPNPKFAPRRNDLPWLRRRRKPPAPIAAAPPKAAPTKAAPAKTPPPRPTPPPAPTGPRIDYTRHDRSHATPTPPTAPTPPTPPAPPPAPPRAPTPRSAPVASSDSSLDLSLDLSAPTPAPAPAPAPRSEPPSASGNPLDLSSSPTTPPTPPAPSASTSLDLDGPAHEPPARDKRRAVPPAPPPDRHHVVRRTRSRATTLLDFGAPVVTLDRLQSGVGELTLDAVVGDEVGDLRIGAAWELADGRTGTVELDANRRHGPEDRRPVVWAQKEGRFERIALDLRQTRSLRRLLVYGFSASRQTLNWGGTLVVTTYGGDRIDVPIVSDPSPAVIGLVSVYNVDGEFVLRAEMDPVGGSVRDTCRAFGFDRITWLDDRTPVG